MRRALTANIGWLLIIAGLVTIMVVGINLYSLITSFVGFFLRLIYNSEKYKYFKFLSAELLLHYGKSVFQQEARTNYLFGFYRGIVDFLAVIILPFIMIPRLHIPWYCDWLLGIAYILALKPIFSSIDELDKRQIKQIVNGYGREKTNREYLANRYRTGAKNEMKIGLFHRICMFIPYLRHRMVRNTMQEHANEHELLNIVNRSVSYMIARNVVNIFNSGKIDINTIGGREYHKHMIVELFGNKAKDIADRITCEKATIKSAPCFSVYLFNLPSSMDIGQNDIVAYVINPNGKAYSYSWEWSVNGAKMICSWEDDKHLNFGECNDKVEFVKTIVELSDD